MKPHKKKKTEYRKNGVAILVNRTGDGICLVHYKRGNIFPQKIRSIQRTTENRSNDMKWLIEGEELVYDI